VGRGDHGRVAAHRRVPRKPLDQHETVPATKEGEPGAAEPPGHPARQPGRYRIPGT
jgi:hypothetical protein